jgi:hypothetical protein
VQQKNVTAKESEVNRENIVTLGAGTTLGLWSMAVTHDEEKRPIFLKKKELASIITSCLKNN